MKVDASLPQGPYAQVRKRLGKTVIEEFPYGSPPEDVADCISEAISTVNPRLRWLVGRGAERNVANRRSISDERWIELWHGPEEEYRALLLGEPE